MTAAMDRIPSSTRLVLAVGGLYVAQSVIGGVTWTGLPAVMRERGMSLDGVGLLSLIALPWALKFLWSQQVERFRLPAAGGNRSAMIVLVGGLVCVAGMAAIGLLGPELLSPVIAGLTLVAFAAATVDIACDGYAVESFSAKGQAWGNAAQVGGAYLGAAIGGGLFLVIVASAGWNLGVSAMITLLVALGLPFLLIAAPKRAASTRDHSPSLVSALARREIRRGLVLAAVFVVAQKAGLILLGPFLVDAGLDLTTIGIVNGAGSLIVGFAAALAGGVAVRRWGTAATMIVALLLQASALAFFAAYDLAPGMPRALLATVAVFSSSAVLAFGFVALYAQFMRLSDPRQGGIDFTLFQSMDALVSMVGGVAAGYAAQHFGYAPFFAGACAVAVAAVPAVLLFGGFSPDIAPDMGPAAGETARDLRSGR
jgi:MFS transporter (putative signal transducer)